MLTELLLCSVVLGTCTALVPHWGSCQSNDDCDPTPVQGKPVCCHVGDRRCLTMDDCDWVNWIEKLPEKRNCECIAQGHSGGSAKRWDSCQRTAECDPGLTTDNKRLGCRMGDRRCLTKDDCDWVNWISHTNNDCSVIPEHCFNGYPDGGEPDIDCGKVCPNRCDWGKHCNERADCPSSYGGCDLFIVYGGWGGLTHLCDFRHPPYD
eukprot:m51a1_g7513 hypothetical protein (207) ;mRNA; r:300533-301153